MLGKRKHLVTIERMRYYTEPTDAVLRHLKSRDTGLRTSEYTQRLETYGPNILRVKGEPMWHKLLEPFLNVFIGVLIVAAILSILTGHPIDAIIVGVIILISAVIYYVQTFSTERVLRALRQHDVTTINVWRDGQVIEVSGEELVPGDVVNIGEGEKVPADGRLLHADNVRADEAMLTGESEPVNKHVHALEGEKPVYERTNMLFQGSFVVSGRATMVITTTAAQTEFGRLAALSTPSGEQSPAQQKIDKLISVLIAVIAAIALGAFTLSLVRGIELFEALRFVLALTVSAVPEGLPIAIAVVLVLGMRRLAKYKVLVRSMKAIENVGIVTTIASDKTGTLTKNKLSVQEHWNPASVKSSLPTWVLLAANATDGIKGDPLDTAFKEYAHGQGVAVSKGRTMEESLPFDQALAMSGNIWRVGDRYEMVIKGAPEKVIQRSLKSGSELHDEAERQLHHLTGQGYRVIALGHIEHLHSVPEKIEDAPLDSMKFLGLLAVADELRPEARQAILDAQSAGITVRMVTGDHAETAYAIGRQLGLVEHRDQVLDCRTIDKLSETQLEARVSDTRVFARVIPEAKHRILGILKKNDITAMTGDGVNDVPALTNAHIGVAMGSGSQIAKEAGDIVLLNDNFASIIQAVRGGRVIFDNIRRMLFYLLATSLGEVLVSVGALLLGIPLPLVAVQILWINLATDSALVIPLGLEPAEEDVMKRRPRTPSQPILDRHLIVRLALVASTMAVLGLGIFFVFLQSHSADYARTIIFSTLILMQWANALNARSEWSSIAVRARTLNPSLVFGFSVAALMFWLAIFGPLAGALYVVPVELADVIFTGLIGMAAVIAVVELHKWYGRAVTLKARARVQEPTVAFDET